MKRTDCRIYKSHHAVRHTERVDFVKDCPCCTMEKEYIREFLLCGDEDGMLQEEYMACELSMCPNRNMIEAEMKDAAEFAKQLATYKAAHPTKA